MSRELPSSLLMFIASRAAADRIFRAMHDAGYDDHEIITWAYTADPTLPGRPIDALRENRGAEVKRRAQSMG